MGVSGCGVDGTVLGRAAGSFGAGVGVFAGQELTCALAGGRARCFGANVDGALGSGDEATHLSPVAVAAPVGFERLAVGQNHACGLEHGTGAVWCWGYNASGQLGLGDTAGRDAPVRLPRPASAVALAAGYNHACAVAADHALWCWGDNTEGQLGQADLPGRAERAAAGSRRRATATGSPSRAARGTPAACAPRARCGAGGETRGSSWPPRPVIEQVRAPTQVGTFTDWTAAVDVGQDSSCGIRADGTLWCWGDNSFGQLGAPPESAAVGAPRQVGSQTGWVTISIDAFAACGVRTDGGLWCWGRNAEGQLGTGDNDD